MYGIGEFSKKVNLSMDTIRYYEKEGMLVSKRNASNRRVYNDKDIKWVEFLLRLKKIGMPIRDMKLYSKLRYQGDETIPERMELLKKQEQVLNQKAAEIAYNQNFLHQKMDTYNEMLKIFPSNKS